MAQISFKRKTDTESKSVEHSFPADLAGLTAQFGEESVYAAAKGQYTIGLQAFLRRHYDKDAAELQALATAWNPNERAPAVKQTAMEKASSALGNLTPEERKELINKLRALQQAA